MKWKQRGNTTTVLDTVMRLSGMTEQELVSPSPCPPQNIQNLTSAAVRIKTAIASKEPISIMGDYDCDGVTSGCILYFLLRELGTTPAIRFPRRMSEGYGLSIKAVDEFQAPGLLITVDNGIAANDAIQHAKERGLDVIILDHHLPGDVLPPADIIVDPHIEPDKNGYVEYCGAGLSFKLSQLLLKNNTELLKTITALAAIGTIADGVSLTGDNRYIVKHGLPLLKARDVCCGLNALTSTAEIYAFNEDDIGFKVGPMINAAGRMYDNGANIAFNAITADSKFDAEQACELLLKCNNERKEKTAEAVERTEQEIADSCLLGMVPMVVYVPEILEGIVGIVTGRIAEKYKTPTFILTDSETPGVIKGSGRSYGSINLMDFVDAARPVLLTGGGHAAAAGISCNISDYAEMVNLMQAAAPDTDLADTDTLEYDMKVPADSVAKTYLEVAKYAPFGTGCPKPVFLFENIVLSPRAGATCKYMGKNAEHVKLHAKGFSAIAFGRSEEYRNMGCPSCLDIVGNISQNVFRYASEYQVEITDFQAHKQTAVTSSLLSALRANGTI